MGVPKKRKSNKDLNAEINDAEFFEEVRILNNRLDDNVLKKSAEIDSKHIKSYLSEFLSPFLLIGYNALDNSRVLIHSARNEKDFDSLTALYNKLTITDENDD